MKKAFFVLTAMLATACFSVSAQGVKYDPDPEGSISYALPMTSLVFEVEAVQEKFYAGPYAKYAQKYLGIDARQEDRTSYQITSVKVNPYVEADQESRHVATFGKNSSSAGFFQLTSQGLIATKDGTFNDGSVWRFPSQTSGDFAGKGVSSNLTSEAATLYQGVKKDTSYNKIAVQQDMVVEKSPEQKAREAAEMILNLRKTRVQIVTGDTDANYSGAAMSSALEEIARLEKEYMTLFTGYSEFQTQNKSFDLVPVNDGRENKMFVVFRLSDTEGLLPAENMSGKPYVVDIEAQAIQESGTAKSPKPGTVIYYRIPAICTVKLSDGINVLLQSRIPIYQYGVDKTYPIK